MEHASVQHKTIKLTQKEIVNFVQYLAANLAKLIHPMNVQSVQIVQLESLMDNVNVK